MMIDKRISAKPVMNRRRTMKPILWGRAEVISLGWVIGIAVIGGSSLFSLLGSSSSRLLWLGAGITAPEILPDVGSGPIISALVLRPFVRLVSDNKACCSVSEKP